MPVTSPERSTNAPPDDAGARRGRGLEQATRGRPARDGDEAVGRRDEPAAHPRRGVAGTGRADDPRRCRPRRGSRRRTARERRAPWRRRRRLRRRVGRGLRARVEQHEIGGGVATDDLRAWCTTPSAVVTSIFVGGADEPVAREDLAGPADAHARAAAGPVWSCALTATTECATATATACAVAIGSARRAPRSARRRDRSSAERADRAEHGERQDRAGGAGDEGRGPHRLRPWCAGAAASGESSLGCSQSRSSGSGSEPAGDRVVVVEGCRLRDLVVGLVVPVNPSRPRNPSRSSVTTRILVRDRAA